MTSTNEIDRRLDAEHAAVLNDPECRELAIRALPLLTNGYYGAKAEADSCMAEASGFGGNERRWRLNGGRSAYETELHLQRLARVCAIIRDGLKPSGWDGWVGYQEIQSIKRAIGEPALSYLEVDAIREAFRSTAGV